VSFALVFGCDLLCDLGVVSFSRPAPAIVSNSPSHNHNHENGSDHHGSSAASGNDHHSQSHKHGNDSNTADECCDDLTRQFYSTLVSSSGASTGSLIHASAFRLISALSLPDVFKVESFNSLRVASAYDHHSNAPPGGKVGRGLCIILSTFLI
jgi:hypothetical protein